MKFSAWFTAGKIPPFIVAALMLGNVAADEASTESSDGHDTAERCRAPEYRAFDFWLGSWDVRNPEGELVGHNEIRRISGGCGLLENWRSVAGIDGTSINTYDAGLDKWTQRWVGAGATLWLEGGLEDGRMVLAGTSPRSTPRGDALDRITWTALPDGRVSQVWELSADKGASWQKIFVGYYSAAPGGAVMGGGSAAP